VRTGFLSATAKRGLSAVRSMNQCKFGICVLALTVVIGLAAAPTPRAHAQTYTTLYSFCPKAPCKRGFDSDAGLVMDSKGNLYGTTQVGGSDDVCFSEGCGTVFMVVGRKESVLHSFKGAALDGAIPSYGNLLLDAEGNLYGATVNGGDGGCEDGGPVGCGTVFKVTGKKETVLHSFTGEDGRGPIGNLVMDSSGGLYGTTMSGGANDGGTVFQLDAGGTETVLYSFCSKKDCADGQIPYGGLVMDAKGNLYGTTFAGGTGDCGLGACGTVFKVTRTGKETVLHSFCSTTDCADGAGPVGALIIDSAGNLYGTTINGGTGTGAPCLGGSPGGCGTVFKVDTSGAETVLHSFCSAAGCSDGIGAWGGLFMDVNGDLYGTTLYGGTGTCVGSYGGCGTVFELDTSGTETVLHSFTGVAPDGEYPYSNLIMDANGNLYGTSAAGGKFDGGVVFELTRSGAYDTRSARVNVARTSISQR
jgi:uncharacterized repeat protein (TIGR03803 family)